ncbi:MAG: hypothetical protein ACLU9S_12175 [Oscillospiraceae bacterium]
MNAVRLLIPKIAVVTDIRVDTPDVKTFRVVGLDGKKPFVHIPGQCAMLSMPGRRRGAVLHHLLPDGHRVSWSFPLKSAAA